MVKLVLPQEEMRMRFEGQSLSYSQVPARAVTSCHAGPQRKHQVLARRQKRDEGKSLDLYWGFHGKDEKAESPGKYGKHTSLSRSVKRNRRCAAWQDRFLKLQAVGQSCFSPIRCCITVFKKNSECYHSN